MDPCLGELNPPAAPCHPEPRPGMRSATGLTHPPRPLSNLGWERLPCRSQQTAVQELRRRSSAARMRSNQSAAELR